MCKNIKTNMMLVGCFHFMEEELNLLSTQTQQELNELVAKLAKFNPDKIIVEAPIEAQHQLVESFEQLPINYFEDTKLMEETILGTITIAGADYPITYCNEAIQIGYRLAKLLNLDGIHAVDYIELQDESEIYEKSTNQIIGWSADSSEFWKTIEFEKGKNKGKSFITK